MNAWLLTLLPSILLVDQERAIAAVSTMRHIAGIMSILAVILLLLGNNNNKRPRG